MNATTAPPAEPASGPTDDELRLALRRHPGTLPSAQAEAGSLMRQARQLSWAPVGRIDAQWHTFQQRMKAAAAPPGANHNSAIDWAARVKMLRIALEAAEVFGAYAKLPREQLIALWRQDRDATVVAMQLVTTGAAAAAHIPGGDFDAALCVRQLGQRGVTLSLGSDGSLLASPAGLLTTGDRAELVAHEAVLRAFLATAERVA